MNTPTISHHAADAAQKSDLARLLRQASVLREQSDPVRASRLEANEIATVVREIREAHGQGALPEGELQAMVAQEERRVAEAVILAKILISQLVGYFPAPAGPGPASPVRAAAEPVAAKTAAGPPAISDMLDAMLAAERTGRRPSPAFHHES